MRVIRVETNGLCLLCFKECLREQKRSNVSRGGGDASSPTHVELEQRNDIAAQKLCKFLQRYFGFDYAVDMKLCDECAWLAKRLSDLFQSYEVVRMKLHWRLRSVFDVIKQAERTRRRRRKYHERIPEEKRQTIRKLRHKITKKCLKILENGKKPVVSLVKLEERRENKPGALRQFSSHPQDNLLNLSLFGCIISFWIVISLSAISPDEIVQSVKQKNDLTRCTTCHENSRQILVSIPVPSPNLAKNISSLTIFATCDNQTAALPSPPTSSSNSDSFEEITETCTDYETGGSECVNPTSNEEVEANKLKSETDETDANLGKSEIESLRKSELVPRTSCTIQDGRTFGYDKEHLGYPLTEGASKNSTDSVVEVLPSLTTSNSENRLSNEESTGATTPVSVSLIHPEPLGLLQESRLTWSFDVPRTERVPESHADNSESVYITSETIDTFLNRGPLVSIKRIEDVKQNNNEIESRESETPSPYTPESDSKEPTVRNPENVPDKEVISTTLAISASSCPITPSNDIEQSEGIQLSSIIFPKISEEDVGSDCTPLSPDTTSKETPNVEINTVREADRRSIEEIMYDIVAKYLKKKKPKNSREKRRWPKPFPAEKENEETVKKRKEEGDHCSFDSNPPSPICYSESDAGSESEQEHLPLKIIKRDESQTPIELVDSDATTEVDSDSIPSVPSSPSELCPPSPSPLTAEIQTDTEDTVDTTTKTPTNLGTHEVLTSLGLVRTANNKVPPPPPSTSPFSSQAIKTEDNENKRATQLQDIISKMITGIVDKFKYNPTPPKPMPSSSSSYCAYLMCDICGLQFDTRAKIEKHRVLCHSQKEYVKCPMCSIMLDSYRSLQIHRRYSTRCEITAETKELELRDLARPIFPYVPLESKFGDIFCPYEECYEVFPFTSQLRTHLRTHGRYRCLFCEREFEKASDLAFHEFQIHSKKVMNEGLPKFLCARCNYFGDREHEYLQHFFELHLCLELEVKNDMISPKKSSETCAFQILKF